MPDIAAQIETALAVMRLFDEIKSLLPEGVPIRSANCARGPTCWRKTHIGGKSVAGSRTPGN
jgi:hypothetical protein